MVLRTSPLPLVPRDLVSATTVPADPAEPDIDGDPTVSRADMPDGRPLFPRSGSPAGEPANAPAQVEQAVVPR